MLHRPTCFFAAVLLGLGLLGTGCSAGTGEADATGPGEAAGTITATGDYFRTQADAAEQRIRIRLSILTARIDSLQGQAQVAHQQGHPALAEAHHAVITDLKAERRRLAQDLNALRVSTIAAWEGVRTGWVHLESDAGALLEAADTALTTLGARLRASTGIAHPPTPEAGTDPGLQARTEASGDEVTP